jgi:hypothetical protein
LKLDFATINLRGSPGFLDGWQRHHLIPKYCMKDPETRIFLRKVERVGFDVNDYRSNGILLPTTYADAELYGLPFHSGPHPRYNKYVRAGILRLAFDFDLVNNPCHLYDALTYIRYFQGRLRTGMVQPRPISINYIKIKPRLRGDRLVQRAIDTRDFGQFDPIVSSDN